MMSSWLLFICFIIGLTAAQRARCPVRFNCIWPGFPFKKSQLSSRDAADFAIEQVNMRVSNGDLLLDVAIPLKFEKIVEVTSTADLNGTLWHMIVETVDDIDEQLFFEAIVVEPYELTEPFELVKVKQVQDPELLD